jgi:hydroxyacylglutathione hydrolase
MPAGLEIVRVPVLSDNYVWLVHDPVSAETVVIDPGEAGPVEAALDERGWVPSAIWITHWHPDHTGGAAALKAQHPMPVFAPAAEADKIPAADHLLGEGDTVRLGAHQATVLETPAHTLGHISYHLAHEAVAFVGDTLFVMGCGRLLEGTAEQMFASLARYAALPSQTRLYCAHEYTLANAHFAAHAEPGNAAVAARLAEVAAARKAGAATVPTTVAEERATNPFMRAGTVADLARLRAEKDAF